MHLLFNVQCPLKYIEYNEKDSMADKWMTAALPSDASAPLSADQHISQTAPEVPPQPTVLVQASLSYFEAILNVKRKDTDTFL